MVTLKALTAGRGPACISTLIRMGDSGFASDGSNTRLEMRGITGIEGRTTEVVTTIVTTVIVVFVGYFRSGDFSRTLG